MSRSDHRRSRPHPPHGQIGYLQLPAVDIARSAAFYEAVFGWSVDVTDGSFEAPGMIGHWTTDRRPSSAVGPVVWICADQLAPALQRAVAARPAQPQTLIAVRDVEASSAWYQQLLGLHSDHGGPHYERLVADGVLVLQLHSWETEHDHGRIGDPDVEPGNGVVLWFGEVADFDAAVERADHLGATIVLPPHRNPPEGQGNGPGHREIWIKDPDGYTVVIASPDGEAYEP